MILIIEDIDKIYNLGDNIGIGHETNKVLDTIFDRDDMEIIAGNHDEAVMSLVNNTPYPEDLKDKFYEHHQWMRVIWMKITMTSLIYYLDISKNYLWKKLLFIHYEIENQKLETGIEGQPFSPITENSKRKYY